MIVKEPRKQLRFNVDIVHHCNLNCCGCGHFSPLAKEYYLPVDLFRKDIQRLSSLTGGTMERIDIMGGEPLLHPQIIEILDIARKNFVGEINICTNGILLDKMHDEFFNACHRYDVALAVTVYPISLDWDKMSAKCQKHGVTLTKIGTKGHDRRLWYKNHRDLTGGQDIEANFADCRWGNNCIILENGRLATCVIPFKAKYYNEFYQCKGFKVSEQDSIDIYSTDSIQTILEFLSRPIPCCRYCMPNNDELIDWKISKKDIEEWS